MTEKQMVEIASNNVERHICNIADIYAPQKTAFDAMEALAFDALFNAKVDPVKARAIAFEVARRYIQL